LGSSRAASARLVSGPAAMMVTCPGWRRTADQKVGGDLVRRFDVGRAGGRRRDQVGICWMRRTPRDALVGPLLGPCPLVVELAVQALPCLGARRRVHQRQHRARNDRHVGALRDFQQPQGLIHLFVAPAVAADDGDAEHLDVAGLQQHQYRLQVGTGRTIGVLIDDDQALVRIGPGDRGGQRRDGENQHPCRERAASIHTGTLKCSKKSRNTCAATSASAALIVSAGDG
jgi:hypothetical protein